MNAASSRGKPLTALVHASGASRNHINSNHAKTTASTTPAAIASIIAALSGIGNSFGFSRPRNHSLKSRLQTSAPTVVATNFVAPHSRANAGHRECVSGR